MNKWIELQEIILTVYFSFLNPALATSILSTLSHGSAPVQHFNYDTAKANN